MLDISNIKYNRFSKILFDGPLGKTEFYVYRVEFQVRGSPHIHAFLWIKNAPKLTLETAQQYINFVEKTVSEKLPDPSEQPEPYNYVKTIHTHSRTCWKYKKKISVGSIMVVIFQIEQ